MISLIPLNKIKPNPWQTRTGELDQEYIKELAADIAFRGLLQTPIGREAGEDIQLAFGHNRFAAFQWLYNLRDNSDIPGDYSTMPIDIRELTDEQMAELAWAENEKRRDVTPIERALAIQHRMADFGWTQTDAAEHLGIDRSSVSNILRLLRLPQKIQDALASGSISERVAISLLPMYELPEHVLKLAKDNWYNDPSRIEFAALNGTSSDEIRSKVDALRQNYTRPLQKAEFGLDELYPEGIVAGYDGSEGGTVYCGTCRACDRRLKDTGNVCLDIGCYKAKTALYRRAYLLEACGAANIEVVDPNKGGNPTPLPYRDDQARQILATHCENLRLVYSENLEKNDARVVSGYPHALIVCDKRNGSCSCAKGLDLIKSKPAVQVVEKNYTANFDDSADEAESVGAQTPPAKQIPGALELEEIARQARKEKRDVPKAHKELVERLTNLAVEWLRYDEPGAFYALIMGDTYPSKWRPVDIESLYRVAAERVVRVIAGDGSDSSVEDMYRLVNRKLEALHLPEIGREKTLVEIYQEEEAA